MKVKLGYFDLCSKSIIGTEQHRDGTNPTRKV